MSFGIFETGGVDDFIRPFFGISIGRLRFGAGAEFFLGFLVRFLRPLIHLHLAREADRVVADLKHRVCHGVWRLRLAAQMDQFPLVGCLVALVSAHPFQAP